MFIGVTSFHASDVVALEMMRQLTQERTKHDAVEPKNPLVFQFHVSESVTPQELQEFALFLVQSRYCSVASFAAPGQPPHFVHGRVCAYPDFTRHFGVFSQCGFHVGQQASGALGLFRVFLHIVHFGLFCGAQRLG